MFDEEVVINLEAQLQAELEEEERIARQKEEEANIALEQEDAKRQRIEEENECAKLKRCLEIVPDDEDDVEIEATPLSSKSPTNVD
uniref:Uncharacterized protein n=1 Tax=Tanacetum cinerariifolium TaxID=118510 RepID=A0A699TZM2_TANCI|nr:hypothetical protein [Tanacetum cinerariifolium]